MSSKIEKDKVKQLQDKCQTVLNELLRDEDNKYCVDCDSKGPRWASWNIGVFLCIRCAGIHRNLGVHISKVKSVNLDTWTPEQVVSLQQMGNSRARAVYEANLPDNFRRPQSDSGLESFIRAKYEHKKYIAREWVPPALPKVNWEKEIDEETEKQKRKKKTIIEKKQLGAVEVPQLPKPTNPSPKPNRVASSTPELKDKKGNDLLGLQNGEDSFGGFLSAPASVISNDEQKDSADMAKSEEESFFNQSLPTEKEKVKLDKNSILALYANTPPATSNNFTQFSSSAGIPATAAYQPGGFPAPQSTFPQFGGLPQQAFAPLQNGVQPQFGSQWPGPQGQVQTQWGRQPTTGQFPGQNSVQYVPANQQPVYPMNTQVPVVPGQYNQLQQTQGVPPAFNQIPNPFFSNQSSMQQQFGNLSIGNQTTSSGPTVASNILWQ